MRNLQQKSAANGTRYTSALLNAYNSKQTTEDVRDITEQFMADVKHWNNGVLSVNEQRLSILKQALSIYFKTAYCDITNTHYEQDKRLTHSTFWALINCYTLTRRLNYE